MRESANRIMRLWLLLTFVTLNAIMAYGADEWIDFALDYDNAYYCDNGELMYFYDDFTAYYTGAYDCDIEWEWGYEPWTMTLYFEYDEGEEAILFNIEGSEKDGYTFYSNAFNMNYYPSDEDNIDDDVSDMDSVRFEPTENMEIQIQSFGEEDSINISITFEHLNEFMNTEGNSLNLLISNANLTYETEYEPEDFDGGLWISTFDWDRGLRTPKDTDGYVSCDITGDNMTFYIEMTPSGFEYSDLKYVSLEFTYQNNYGGPVFTFKREGDTYRLLDHLSLYDRYMYVPINYCDDFIDF